VAPLAAAAFGVAFTVLHPDYPAMSATEISPMAYPVVRRQPLQLPRPPANVPIWTEGDLLQNQRRRTARDRRRPGVARSSISSGPRQCGGPGLAMLAAQNRQAPHGGDCARGVINYAAAWRTRQRPDDLRNLLSYYRRLPWRSTKRCRVRGIPRAAPRRRPAAATGVGGSAHPRPGSSGAQTRRRRRPSDRDLSPVAMIRIVLTDPRD
jgi:hypothetical protein